MKKAITSRLCAVMAAAAAVCLTLPAAPVHAENFQFITDVRLASGENAQDELEAAGYSVMAVGLNVPLSDTQVYLGYKLNAGTPITNLLIAPDTGDTMDVDGMQYTCAAHVDVDEGNGGGAGCVYYTRDERAGKLLVALNVLRADVESSEELLPIPNDGAEVVRRPDGAPADLESKNAAWTIYLAQIHDGLVKPYISEIVPVAAEDRESAVYQAAVWGYNYFIEGDIDTAEETYTILAYKRTMNPAEAITDIAAVSADVIRQLEEQQVTDKPETTVSETETQSAETAETTSAETANGTTAGTETTAEAETTAKSEMTTAETTAGSAEADETAESTVLSSVSSDRTAAESPLNGDAIGISGVEYARISRTEIAGEQPFYLYITRAQEAGNPISMLYVGETGGNTDILLGTWISGYFGTKSASGSYAFSANEDLYMSLERDMTVYTRVPVSLLTAVDEISSTA